MDLAAARDDEAAMALAERQKMQREAIADALKDAREKVAAVDGASDNAAATAADEAITALEGAIAGEALSETDSSVVGAKSALEELKARLGPAKTRLAARIQEEADAEAKAAREAANKVAAAVEDAIKRHSASSVSAPESNGAITEVKISRKDGDTVIALRDADGMKRVETNGRANAQSPGPGWNGDSFSFADPDGVMQKGAVFSNIKSPRGQAYDEFFDATDGAGNNTAYDSTTGQLTFATTATGLKASYFTGGVVPARNGDTTEYSAPGGDTPLNKSGTYRGIPGTFTCSDACTIQRDANGEISITVTTAGLVFKPTLSGDDTPADLFVAGVIPDADYLHFGYWMASSKQRGGSYRHVIDTFADGSGYGNVTDASGETGTATYTGAAGGYYTHEGERDGALTVTSGEFSAEASLTVSFGGPTISANDAFSIKGTISNFIGDGPADQLEDWKLMLETAALNTETSGRTSIVSTGRFSGTTSDSLNPGAEDGEWAGQLYGDSNGNGTGGVPEAVAGEFNGNFENGHVAGAFGAEHAD